MMSLFKGNDSNSRRSFLFHGNLLRSPRVFTLTKSTPLFSSCLSSLTKSTTSRSSIQNGAEVSTCATNVLVFTVLRQIISVISTFFNKIILVKRLPMKSQTKLKYLQIYSKICKICNIVQDKFAVVILDCGTTAAA